MILFATEKSTIMYLSLLNGSLANFTPKIQYTNTATYSALLKLGPEQCLKNEPQRKKKRCEQMFRIGHSYGLSVFPVITGKLKCECLLH